MKHNTGERSPNGNRPTTPFPAESCSTGTAIGATQRSPTAERDAWMPALERAREKVESYLNSWQLPHAPGPANTIRIDNGSAIVWLMFFETNESVYLVVESI